MTPIKRRLPFLIFISLVTGLTSASAQDIRGIYGIKADVFRPEVGIVDLVTANQSSNTVTFWRGDGEGNFTPTRTVPVTGMRSPEALDTGDFDRDGCPDIAVSNSGSDNVSILRGNCLGGFFFDRNLVVGRGPRSLVVRDFNGDGNADIAVANQESDNVSILLGLPDGRFASPTHFPVGSGPSSLAAGDFNGDGRLDIALSHVRENQAWVARYNGPGNGDDKAVAIATDSSGNIYVTGSSVGAQGRFDYLTIKYDRNGQQLWQARYNTSPKRYHALAVALAIDSSGNVYVTGQASPSSGFNPRYTTVKYNNDGQQLWVADDPRYYNDQIPTGIAVDNSDGSIYVTGTAGLGPSRGATTIKFDRNGRVVWNVHHERSIADVIALDARGDVYVSMHGGTAKYDRRTGNIIWTAGLLVESAAIAIDANNNVYVTGRAGPVAGQGWNYATAKYEQLDEGRRVQLAWIATYNGPANGDDEPSALAVDSSGNVYVTGRSAGVGTGFDYATVKYDRNGNQVWVARYNGPGNGNDEARAIAIEAGRVYVTGSSFGGIATGLDYATIEYNALNGTPISVQRYNGPGSRDDVATAIAVRLGNVYVTGESFGGASGLDYATIKYDGNLNVASTFLGNGDGTFRPGSNSIVRRLPQAIVAEDFDGDGCLDLATANFAANNVSILLGNRTGDTCDGTFRSSGDFRADFRPLSLVAGDFDADGIMDLAVTNSEANTVSILFGNGDGSFSSATNLDVGVGVRNITAGDFNGDGLVDLATANAGGPGQPTSLTILLGNGDGTFNRRDCRTDGCTKQ